MNINFFKRCVLILLCMLLGACGLDDNQTNSTIENESKKEEKNSIKDFAKLEKTYDARLGVFALHTGTNEMIAYRADERFAYASTHKALAVGALLQQKSIPELNKRIRYSKNDLVNYNPITEKFVELGMTLKELCEASIRYSDNTAGNLILNELGGPNVFKQLLEAIGDTITNPVRMEPELNDVEPGEIQDTSTPRALATSLQAYTLGDVLENEKRALLVDWLKRNTTGDNLIRAGTPKGWVVGDKTGAAAYGTRNDIGIIWPPNDAPIILSVLSSRNQEDADYDDQLIADATKSVIKTFYPNVKFSEENS
ncbi:class A beta-lactamase [Radiobacillus deserti]|uniref:Beta-lactamase n=1 Tax=Radiobacillus deserti TaxID=2594883 RepID=A0A516KC56_9BACI|nr:class A beta-lactamase [Radiobacillus deserti]QDP38960.1 class A beta-lactamase [Radiobacillus deserti]